MAWGAFAAALLALGGAVLLGSHNAAVAPASVTGAPDALLWLTSWLGFGIVGVMLIQRRPAHTIGWILLGIPTVTYLTLFLEEYAIQGLVVEPGSLPLALAAGWVSKWSFALALGLVIALVLVFLRGRIGGRVMRWVARAVAVLVVSSPSCTPSSRPRSEPTCR